VCVCVYSYLQQPSPVLSTRSALCPVLSLCSTSSLLTAFRVSDNTLSSSALLAVLSASCLCFHQPSSPFSSTSNDDEVDPPSEPSSSSEDKPAGRRQR
jgi:hypothetical protein